MREGQRMRLEDALEIAEFAEKCTRRDNPEANPDTPDVSTEDRDEFVAKELCMHDQHRVRLLLCERDAYGYTHGWE